MSAKSHYFKIGVFVIVAVNILILGIIVLGAGTLFREKIMLETYIDESVQGLDVGSPVKYRGVQIGNVENITFVRNKYRLDPSDSKFQRYWQYVLVEMSIYPDIFTFGTAQEIREGLQNAIANGLSVRLAALGLTGVAYLEAEFVDPDRFPPPPIAWEPKSIYIPAGPSTITRFTRAVEDVLGQARRADIEGIGDDVKELLEALTMEIKALQVAAVREEVKQSLASIRKTSDSLDAILESDEVQQALKNVVEGSEGLKRALEKFPDTVALVNRTVRRVDNLISSQRQDIEVIVDDLRHISDSLKALTGNAERYPSHVLFGEPPPRVELRNRR